MQRRTRQGRPPCEGTVVLVRPAPATSAALAAGSPEVFLGCVSSLTEPAADDHEPVLRRERNTSVAMTRPPMTSSAISLYSLDEIVSASRPKSPQKAQ
jgi:hypothetical protein